MLPVEKSKYGMATMETFVIPKLLLASTLTSVGIACWAAPPCGIFSAALCWSGVRRSKTDPWARRMNLDPKQRGKVRLASKVVWACLSSIAAIYSRGQPWILENLWTSLPWSLPELQEYFRDKLFYGEDRSMPIWKLLQEKR